MPRIARFLKENEPTVYHVISRTALDGLPFNIEKKGHANNAQFGFVNLLSLWVRWVCWVSGLRRE